MTDYVKQFRYLVGKEPYDTIYKERQVHLEQIENYLQAYKTFFLPDLYLQLKL